VADEPVYRAVFLRMHPTGGTVLSLTEGSQGQEARFAQIAAQELGIPSEDIKVVPEDTDRFGEGHSFNTSPSQATADNVAITARKLRDKAELIAAWMLGTSPGSLRWDNGRWFVGSDREGGVKIQEVALRAFAGGTLPEGVEGGLDAQTTYRD
jgi:carbon-monoxide dehydrogenase large subunit